MRFGEKKNREKEWKSQQPIIGFTEKHLDVETWPVGWGGKKGLVGKKTRGGGLGKKLEKITGGATHLKQLPEQKKQMPGGGEVLLPGGGICNLPWERDKKTPDFLRLPNPTSKKEKTWVWERSL